MAWFRKGSTAADDAAEWARPIQLNAGGILYVTSRGTLRHLSEHPVFGPIVRGTASRSAADDGSSFIDCDGTLFRHVLNFLHNTCSPSPSPETTAAAALCLPESFDEWEQLLAEARRLQLPALESAIAERYEYQRSLFSKMLPLGVLVRWPTAVIVRQEPLPERQNPAVTSPTTGASGFAVADPLAKGASQVTITPPLPSLWVAEDGRTVCYGPEAEVVPDLERLVLLMVSAYGYGVEHWLEKEGRVFLRLRQ